MNSFAQALKRKLTSLIGEMSVSKCLFVRFPKKDFTRKRKLPFGDIITTIIAMGATASTKNFWTLTTTTPIPQRHPLLFNNETK